MVLFLKILSSLFLSKLIHQEDFIIRHEKVLSLSVSLKVFDGTRLIFLQIYLCTKRTQTVCVPTARTFVFLVNNIVSAALIQSLSGLLELPSLRVDFFSTYHGILVTGNIVQFSF